MPRLRTDSEDQQRMCEGVIANHVPGRATSRTISGRCRTYRPIMKKCSAHIVLRQHFQQLQRVRIIRPVIVGERNLLAPAREAQ